MESSRIYYQLTDLPPAFTPGGPVYDKIIGALTSGMSILGLSTEALLPQMSFGTSSGNWLSVWLTLLGIPNDLGLPDSEVAAYILGIITARASTPAGIEAFLRAFIDPGAQVTEDFTDNGGSYSITFSLPLTTAQIENAIKSLNRIRPVGVPFLPILVLQGGVYLNAGTYLNMSFSSSSFLIAPVRDVYPEVPASTPSIISEISPVLLNFPSGMGTI